VSDDNAFPELDPISKIADERGKDSHVIQLSAEQLFQISHMSRKHVYLETYVTKWTKGTLCSFIRAVVALTILPTREASFEVVHRQQREVSV
jgi:hypothetical protein